MPDDDLAQRAARHQIHSERWPFCAYCATEWPCDVSLLAAALAVEAVARSWAEQQLAAEQAARAKAEAVIQLLAVPADQAAAYCHGRPDGLTFQEWVTLCAHLVNLEEALGASEDVLGHKLPWAALAGEAGR